MGNVLLFTEARRVGFEDYEERELNPTEVRLQTLYSGISAGTELTAYRGSNPYLKKLWNKDFRVFENSPAPSTSYPMKCWGYEEVGQVIEVGKDVQDVQVGEVVFGTWAHRTTHIVEESFAKEHKLHKELDPICGIFSQMGSIALNAIFDADIHLGETVAIFGQGVPGQIVMQMAKQNGAKVIVVDLDDNRLEYSKKFGADVVINSSRVDASAEIKKLTNGRGADVCIEIAGSTIALHEAIRAVAYSGKVVASGFYQGEGRGLVLGEEFHHNRINVICSQISGVNPSLTYRWNRVRMDNTIMDLQKDGKLNLKGLVTHVFSYEESGRAYEMLDKGTENCLQVVLSFNTK